jgi:hypothetical protein
LGEPRCTMIPRIYPIARNFPATSWYLVRGALSRSRGLPIAWPSPRDRPAQPRDPPRSRGNQLAWLTDDMLKPSIRTGGIAARLK